MYTLFLGESSKTLLKPGLSQKLKSGLVVLKTGEEVGTHSTHKNEELIIILEGIATVQIKNERAEITAGNIIFIPPHSLHNIKNLYPQVLKYIYAVTAG